VSEMTSVCMPPTLRRRASSMLAEFGHDGGADANGATPSRM
jgi:hypothetical protein